MSTVEIYDPKFDDFHGNPMVTWREKSDRDVRITLNLLAKYFLWRNDKGPKHDLPDVFWQSNGPAIVRAVSFCGAKALIFDWTSDRKVAYRWFAKSPTRVGSGHDYYHVCPVYAEGGNGNQTRVSVTLPTGEDVVFTFQHTHMKEWLKPRELTLEEMASKPGGPDPRFGEG